jgi:NDP-sugar pyrophosphorylase family protein
MKAMILAAGLGTRLRPLTDDRPKALVEIAGRTLLEITLSRLRGFDIHEVIINVHHFADRILDYLEANRNFGMDVAISREDSLLDTGGGLKKAAAFFLEDSRRPDEPFLLHNVDVISTIDFRRMLDVHTAQRALATLAVQDRETDRALLFGERHELCGRRAGRNREAEPVQPPRKAQALAFCGIHVISPRIFAKMTDEGAFSIITPYLRLAGAGERILAFPADEYYWCDLGSPEGVLQAAQDLKERVHLE